MVVAFIDDHRDRFGVAPICRVLSEHGVPIAPSGYYAFKSRPVSARALRDAELVVEIERVFHDRNKGRGICGARKVWRLLAREGIEVGRGRVERLMRAQGLRGVRRDRQFVTTRPDPGTQRPRITCSGTSTPIGPTPCGWLISPTCTPGQASSTSPS